MFGDGVPWIVGKHSGEFKLLWIVEGLARKAKSGHRDSRGKPFRPKHGCVFDGHEKWICLHLYTNVELHVAVGKRSDHCIPQIVVRRTERQIRDLRFMV